MKIINKEIQIPKSDTLSSGYIESELLKQGIDPLRWAIVKTDENLLTVNVAFVAE